MYNKPERGSEAVCPHCAVPHRNSHSMRQSGQCDGIKKGTISGNNAMQIRMNNSGKKARVQE